MYKIGEDEMVICPYNRYHIVSKLRIQRHIVKCKKNHPDIKLATCFYNYCHRLKPEAILEHYEICSHKTRMEGARYNLECYTSTKSSVKRDYQSYSFPNINAKPKFFCDFSSSIQVSCEDIHKLNSSDWDSDDCQGVETEKNSLQNEFLNENNENGNNDYDDDINDVSDSNNYKDDDDINESIDNNYEDDDDDDLEPLPLPKTTSKAFLYVKSKPLTSGSFETSKNKVFGRGKISFAFSEKPRTTDHLLPDLSCVQIDSPKKGGKPRFFLRNVSDSCSASVTSSMIDDCSTLKSEEILDKDIYDEDNNSFILENFDTYIKI